MDEDDKITNQPATPVDDTTQVVDDAQAVAADQPASDTPADDAVAPADDSTEPATEAESSEPEIADNTIPDEQVSEDAVVAEPSERSDFEDSSNSVEQTQPEPEAEPAPEAEAAPEVTPTESPEAEPEAEVESEEGEDKKIATGADEDIQALEDDSNDDPNAKWYVIHTYSGHENKVATAIKQRVESEHLENKIMDVLVPTQEKIEIRGGKKTEVKEKIFPGYILVKMILDDNSWLAVRTTQGVTSFVGIGNKPTPVPAAEVKSIVRFMTQGAAPTFKDVYMVDDTVKITDGPFAEFIGKVDGVDKEHGKVRVLVSIFGRETPVELDFLQVQKL